MRSRDGRTQPEFLMIFLFFIPSFLEFLPLGPMIYLFVLLSFPKTSLQRPVTSHRPGICVTQASYWDSTFLSFFAACQIWKTPIVLWLMFFLPLCILISKISFFLWSSHSLLPLPASPGSLKSCPRPQWLQPLSLVCALASSIRPVWLKDLPSWTLGSCESAWQECDESHWGGCHSSYFQGQAPRWHRFSFWHNFWGKASCHALWYSSFQCSQSHGRSLAEREWVSFIMPPCFPQEST